MAKQPTKAEKEAAAAAEAAEAEAKASAQAQTDADNKAKAKLAEASAAAKEQEAPVKNTQTYVLLRGKHTKDGKVFEKGDELELTEAQAKALVYKVELKK